MEELGLIGLDNFGNIINEKQVMDIPLFNTKRLGEIYGRPLVPETRMDITGVTGQPTNTFNVTGRPNIYTTPTIERVGEIYGRPSAYYDQSGGGGLLDTINSISKSLFD